METKIDILFAGFSGKTNFGSLGWSGSALLKTKKGFVVLDTGGPCHRRQMESRIAKHNCELTDIKAILCTHLHWDHIYNFDLFPNAEIILSIKEWEYANSVSSLGVYPPLITALGERKLRLIKYSGEEVFDKIYGVFTPGHTPGSMTFLIEIDSILHALAGDAIKNRSELLNGKISSTLNLQKSEKSIELIKNLAKRILPGHDSWIRMEKGNAVPEGGNSVEFIYPEGITMGGKSKITLHME